MLQPGAVVYDVGANIGYHASAFANAGAQVYAFEPNAQNYLLLNKNAQNIKQGSSIVCVNCAIGDTVREIYSADIDITQQSNYGGAKLNDNVGTKVQMTTLDNLGLPLPELIKIDVEGVELAVIKGASQLIKQHRPVVYYEGHESMDLAEIYDLLSELGYTRLYWTMVFNYNSKNFKEQTQNIFGGSCIFGIVAWPHDTDIVGLEPVQGSNDTHQRLLDKYNEQLQTLRDKTLARRGDGCLVYNN